MGTPRFMAYGRLRIGFAVSCVTRPAKYNAGERLGLSLVFKIIVNCGERADHEQPVGFEG